MTRWLLISAMGEQSWHHSPGIRDYCVARLQNEITINLSGGEWEFIGRSWMKTSASRGFSPDADRSRARNRLISGSRRERPS
jgi:hypothetical protein